MPRQKIGGFFIRASDFPQLVGEFIVNYSGWGLEDHGGYKLVPQREVVRFIREEYECSYPWALEKLRALVNSRRDMEIVKNKRPRSGDFTEPYIPFFIRVSVRKYR